MRLPLLFSRLPRRARIAPAATVTTIGPGEVHPGDVGIDPAIVDTIWRGVTDLYNTGLQPAMSMCIRYRHRLLIHRAIGHRSGAAPDDPLDAPRIQATPDTLFNLFSASKMVLAMLVHLLDDRGLLHLDDPVEEYLPAFGQNGKHGITLRHLLSHRAGIPAVTGAPVDLDLIDHPEEILDRIYRAAPMSMAGRQLAYHALTSGFVLAEVCRVVDGRDLRTLLDEEVRRPLGFTSFGYGVPAERLPEVAVDTFTGPLPRSPMKDQLERSLGVTLQEAVRVARDPRFLTGVVPAGNVIGTADECCRFMELLLRGGELDGVRVFTHRTVRRATAEQNYREIDRTLMLPVRYGLGFMLGSEHVSFYGPRTPRAFGHLGFTNVLLWADPERELSVAFLNSGKPFLTPELIAWLDIVRVIGASIPRQVLS